MAAPTLVRFFDLSGSVDADPLISQPARDALGDLTTGFGGQILVNAWEVDPEGNKVAPTPGLDLTLAVMTVSSVTSTRPPGATSSTQVAGDFWGRGATSTLVSPGEWQIQTELADVVGFTVAVLAKTGTPATFLKICVARGQRP